MLKDKFIIEASNISGTGTIHSNNDLIEFSVQNAQINVSVIVRSNQLGITDAVFSKLFYLDILSQDTVHNFYNIVFEDVVRLELNLDSWMHIGKNGNVKFEDSLSINISKGTLIFNNGGDTATFNGIVNLNLLDQNESGIIFSAHNDAVTYFNNEVQIKCATDSIDYARYIRFGYSFGYFGKTYFNDKIIFHEGSINAEVTFLNAEYLSSDTLFVNASPWQIGFYYSFFNGPIDLNIGYFLAGNSHFQNDVIVKIIDQQAPYVRNQGGNYFGGNLSFEIFDSNESSTFDVNYLSPDTINGNYSIRTNKSVICFQTEGNIVNGNLNIKFTNEEDGVLDIADGELSSLDILGNIYIEGEEMMNLPNNTITLGKIRTMGSIFTAGNSNIGNVLFSQFGQYGTAPNDLKIKGGGTIHVNANSEFNSDVDFTAGGIILNGGIFHGRSLFQNLDTIDGVYSARSTSSIGGNHFYQSARFVLKGEDENEIWELASYGGDYYADSLIIENHGMRIFSFANEGEIDLYGSLIIQDNSANPIQFASEAMITFRNEEDFSFVYNQGSDTLHVGGIYFRLSDEEVDLKTHLNIANTLIHGGFIKSDSGSITLNKDIHYEYMGEGYFDLVVVKHGNADFTIPLGKDNKYAPVYISGISDSDAAFRLQFKTDTIGEPSTTYDHALRDSSLGYINKCGYWEIEQLAGTDSVYVQLGWSESPCASHEPEDVNIAAWGGTQWENLGNQYFEGERSQGTVYAAGKHLVNEYAKWGLGGECNYKLDVLGYDQIFLNQPSLVKVLPEQLINYKFIYQDSILQESGLNKLIRAGFIDGDTLKIYTIDGNSCHSDTIVIIESEVFHTTNLSSLSNFEGYHLVASDSLITQDSVMIYGKTGYGDYYSSHISMCDTCIITNADADTLKQNILNLTDELILKRGSALLDGNFNIGLETGTYFIEEDAVFEGLLFISTEATTDTIVLIVDGNIQIKNDFQILHSEDKNITCLIVSGGKIESESMFSDQTIIMARENIYLENPVSKGRYFSANNIKFNYQGHSVFLTDAQLDALRDGEPCECEHLENDCNLVCNGDFEDHDFYPFGPNIPPSLDINGYNYIKCWTNDKNLDLHSSFFGLLDDNHQNVHTWVPAEPLSNPTFFNKDLPLSTGLSLQSPCSVSPDVLYSANNGFNENSTYALLGISPGFNGVINTYDFMTSRLKSPLISGTKYYVEVNIASSTSNTSGCPQCNIQSNTINPNLVAGLYFWSSANASSAFPSNNFNTILDENEYLTLSDLRYDDYDIFSQHSTGWVLNNFCIEIPSHIDNLDRITIQKLAQGSFNTAHTCNFLFDDVRVQKVANAGEDKVICLGGSVQIGKSCSIPGATYSWSPLTGLTFPNNDPNSPFAFATPSIETIYTLTVTTPEGNTVLFNEIQQFHRSPSCQATDQVTVSIIPNQAFDFEGPEYSCEDGVYMVMNPLEGYEYTWSLESEFGELTETTGISTAITGSNFNGGILTLTWTLIDGGCSGEISKEIIPCCNYDNYTLTKARVSDMLIIENGNATVHPDYTNIISYVGAAPNPYSFGTSDDPSFYEIHLIVPPNEHLAINGFLIIDVGLLKIEDSDVRFGRNAKLRFHNNADYSGFIINLNFIFSSQSLIVDNSHLWACDKFLWQGIEANLNKHIDIINNSLIEDAISAISCNLQARLNIEDSKLNKNHNHVNIRNTSSNILTPAPFINFHNSTFSCNDSQGFKQYLLELYPPANLIYTGLPYRTASAFRLRNCHNITIGLDDNNRNTIENAWYGIDAQETNLTVKYCDFKDISDNYDPDYYSSSNNGVLPRVYPTHRIFPQNPISIPGHAIMYGNGKSYSTSGGGQQPGFLKVGDVNSNTNTFYDCSNALTILNNEILFFEITWVGLIPIPNIQLVPGIAYTEIEIYNNLIEAGDNEELFYTRGVYIEKAISSAARKIHIHDNKINNINRGIQTQNTRAKIDIINNQINAEAITVSAPRTLDRGIKVAQNIVPEGISNNNAVVINYNKIGTPSLTHTSLFPAIGIRVDDADITDIYNNEIFLGGYTGWNVFLNIGIYINAISNLDVMYNEVRYYDEGTSSNTFGLFMGNSEFARIGYNEFEGLRAGLYNALQLGSTEFTCNIFTNNFYGFFFHNASVKHQGSANHSNGNEWFPTGTGNARKIHGNIFTEEQFTNWYYRSSPAQEAINQNNASSSTEFYCEPTDAFFRVPFSGATICGNGFGGRFSADTSFSAALRDTMFLNKIIHLDNLVLIDTLPYNDYMQLHSITRLLDSDTAMMNAQSPSDTVYTSFFEKMKPTSIYALISVEKAIHSLMLNAEEIQEINGEYHAQYDSLVAPDNPFEYLDMMAERDSLIGKAKSDSISIRFERVATMIDTFDVVHHTEGYWLEAYTHYLTAMSSYSWDFDSLKVSLERIATQDMMQQGSSVFFTHMLLDTVILYQPPSAKLAFDEPQAIESEIKLNVYPNPSKDKVFFELEGDITYPAQLYVYNVSGQLIHNMSITRAISIIDIQDWNNGIYLYRLTNEEGMSYTGKLVVLKE